MTLLHTLCYARMYSVYATLTGMDRFHEKGMCGRCAHAHLSHAHEAYPTEKLGMMQPAKIPNTHKAPLSLLTTHTHVQNAASSTCTRTHRLPDHARLHGQGYNWWVTGQQLLLH